MKLYTEWIDKILGETTSPNHEKRRKIIYAPTAAWSDWVLAWKTIAQIYQHMFLPRLINEKCLLWRLNLITERWGTFQKRAALPFKWYNNLDEYVEGRRGARRTKHDHKMIKMYKKLSSTIRSIVLETHLPVQSTKTYEAAVNHKHYENIFWVAFAKDTVDVWVDMLVHVPRWFKTRLKK